MADDAIDINDLMERVQDDRELLMELLDIFLDDFLPKQKLLTAAVTSKNFEEIRSIGHSLKGASGNISAKKLQAVCLQIEQLGKINSIEGMDQLLSQMDSHFKELQMFIQKLKNK